MFLLNIHTVEIIQFDISLNDVIHVGHVVSLKSNSSFIVKDPSSEKLSLLIAFQSKPVDISSTFQLILNNNKLKFFKLKNAI